MHLNLPLAIKQGGDLDVLYSEAKSWMFGVLLFLVTMLLQVYFDTEGKWGHKFALLILLDYLFIHSLNKYILTTFYLPSAAVGWVCSSEWHKFPTRRSLQLVVNRGGGGAAAAGGSIGVGVGDLVGRHSVKNKWIRITSNSNNYNEENKSHEVK